MTGSEQRQCAVDAAAVELEDLADAFFAPSGERPDVGPADEHRSCAQGERLHHVAPSPHVAVKEHLALAVDGVDVARQYPNRGGRSVERVAAVIRNRDCVCPFGDGAAGILDGGSAFDNLPDTRRTPAGSASAGQAPVFAMGRRRLGSPRRAGLRRSDANSLGRSGSMRWGVGANAKNPRVGKRVSRLGVATRRRTCGRSHCRSGRRSRSRWPSPRARAGRALPWGRSRGRIRGRACPD